MVLPSRSIGNIGGGIVVFAIEWETERKLIKIVQEIMDYIPKYLNEKFKHKNCMPVAQCPIRRTLNRDKTPISCPVFTIEVVL